MRTEIYEVGYDLANYRAPIIESNSDTLLQREQTINNNLLRYVAEFRLGVKFDEFYYREEKNQQTGESYLAATENGPIRDIFQKAITTREALGLSVRREVSECLGFRELEKGILNNESLFVWTSPPGTKEQGYGPYSFTFIGQVIDTEAGKKVRVIPYRNTFSIEEHKDYLKNFSPEVSSFTKDIDFLRQPVFIKPIKGVVETPEDILNVIGEKEKLDTSWYPRLKVMLNPLVNGYINLVQQNASREELIQALHAVENIAIKYKEDILKAVYSNQEVSPLGFDQPIGRVFQIEGKDAPEQAQGSCPPNEKSTLMELQNNSNSENNGFLCPNCKVGHVKGNQCPHCKITKEMWAKKTGINCGGEGVSQNTKKEDKENVDIMLFERSNNDKKIITKEKINTKPQIESKTDSSKEMQENYEEEIKVH